MTINLNVECRVADTRHPPIQRLADVLVLLMLSIESPAIRLRIDHTSQRLLISNDVSVETRYDVSLEEFLAADLTETLTDMLGLGVDAMPSVLVDVLIDGASVGKLTGQFEKGVGTFDEFLINVSDVDRQSVDQALLTCFASSERSLLNYPRMLMDRLRRIAVNRG